jgi:hypothetical protein
MPLNGSENGIVTRSAHRPQINSSQNNPTNETRTSPAATSNWAQDDRGPSGPLEVKPAGRPA